MNWLRTHPWVQTGQHGKIYHVGPNRFAILPEDPVPEDLVETLQNRLQIVSGKSIRVLALEAGLNPQDDNILAIVGKRAGLWTLYPGPHDTMWKFDMGQFPIIQPGGP
jgi:hypothetical protein